jgi:hypothetical protein
MLKQRSWSAMTIRGKVIPLQPEVFGSAIRRASMQ